MSGVLKLVVSRQAKDLLHVLLNKCVHENAIKADPARVTHQIWINDRRNCCMGKGASARFIEIPANISSTREDVARAFCSVGDKMRQMCIDPFNVSHARGKCDVEDTKESQELIRRVLKPHGLTVECQRKILLRSCCNREVGGVVGREVSNTETNGLSAAPYARGMRRPAPVPQYSDGGPSFPDHDTEKSVNKRGSILDALARPTPNSDIRQGAPFITWTQQQLSAPKGHFCFGAPPDCLWVNAYNNPVIHLDLPPISAPRRRVA